MGRQVSITELEIIDFEIKGSQIRFYLGKNREQWGDDWDDAPYECNADLAYGQYIRAKTVIIYDFDDLVLEPCDGVKNSEYCKRGMVERRVPCVIVVPKAVVGNSYETSFRYWFDRDGVIKYYFGDKIGLSPHE